MKKLLSDPSVEIRAGGFFTEEFREKGKREGFLITSLPSGKTALFASKRLPSMYRVGSYGINLEEIENIGCRAIQAAIDSHKIIIIDEIGKMELFSKEFKRLVIEALDSPLKVLATIMERSNEFADHIKKRRDIRFLRLTRENFDCVFSEVLQWMTCL